ncbi:MAG: hypothetical protein U0236_03525 [Nitrospira sp.]
MSDQNSRGRHVNELSQVLLRLPNALLDAERLSYERVHGRVASNGTFLQSVLGDPWFAWLRPLSHSITRLDELVETVQTSSSAGPIDLLDSLRSLLTPAEAGEGFGRHYYDALQWVPEVGMAHAQVRTLLGPRPTPTRREQDDR